MKACQAGWASLVFAIVILGACAPANQPSLIASKKGAVELRAIQSRMFETSDRMKVFRAMIATFQDLGYSITKLEPDTGTISGDKLARLELTATVFPRGENRMIVRSNAVLRAGTGATVGHQVDSPEFYQLRFFEPLSKALFLTALQVEEDDQPTDAASSPKASEGAKTGAANASESGKAP